MAQKWPEWEAASQGPELSRKLWISSASECNVLKNVYGFSPALFVFSVKERDHFTQMSCFKTTCSRKSFRSSRS